MAIGAGDTDQALPLARELAALRTKLEACGDAYARRRVLTDVRWCELDRARALRDDRPALETATSLAQAGDPEARRALELADQLPLESELRSVRQTTWQDTLPKPPRLKLDHLIQALAEQRRAGVEFDAAWRVCLRESGLASSGLTEALWWSLPAWRAAYERKVAPRGYALVAWGDPSGLRRILP
jgi:hypothetical protein